MQGAPLEELYLLNGCGGLPRRAARHEGWSSDTSTRFLGAGDPSSERDSFILSLAKVRSDHI